MKYIVLVLLGLVVGYLLADYLQGQNTIVETVTEYKTDTTYQHYKEKYHIDSLKWVYKSDSIDFFRNKYQRLLSENNVIIVHDTIFDSKPFQAPLRHYEGLEHTLYGNIGYKADVAGLMLNMELFNDIKVQTITNTITATNTVIKKPAGLFITAGMGINNNFSTPYIGAIFVKDRYLLGLNTSGFQFGYKISH